MIGAMPRVAPAPPDPHGNAVSNSLLARVMGRRPDILKAFARLDTTIRFKYNPGQGYKFIFWTALEWPTRCKVFAVPRGAAIGLDE